MRKPEDDLPEQMKLLDFVIVDYINFFSQSIAWKWLQHILLLINLFKQSISFAYKFLDVPKLVSS